MYKWRTNWWAANKHNRSCRRCTNIRNSKQGAEKISKSLRGRKLTLEHKAKVIKNGQGKLVRGSIYEYWREKHGQEEADLRLQLLKSKHSKNNAGANNPMYGKPAPKGSGNGWSGWYKGWFFRSLRELKYALELDSVGIHWISAEKQQYKVKYIDHLGQERNYFPDFLVGDHIVVECKPKKLWKSPKVQAKVAAARKCFAELGLQFKLLDPGEIEETTFRTLWESGIIKLTSRYEQKAQERFHGKRKEDPGHS